MTAQPPMSMAEFLRQNEHKELLRFSTAGSVDDGKSTLIGRLLHDAQGIYADQLVSVRAASVKDRSEEGYDFSLVTDGLKAEREQAITIDVAYRYFSTPRRKFIIADTPGHEQYTRNMATGASTANLAVILIDARLGLLAQTKRHAFIASLLGIPHFVMAVNKMDLVGYAESVFAAIRDDFSNFAARLNVVDIRFIPVSALKGDNVVKRSRRMPWYKGESLLELLETIHISSDRNLIDMRFPVQQVFRPSMEFRGYAGQVASGVVRKGDEVLALPSMRTTRVASLVTFAGEVAAAFPPMSVVLTLADHLDLSRGDMLVHPHNLPKIERHFEAMLIWMNPAPMDLNRPYLLKHTTKLARVRIDEVRYRVDVTTLSRNPSAILGLNEIGRVVFSSNQPLLGDAYTRNRATGCFILIDALSNHTVAAGMLIDREPAERLPARAATTAQAGQPAVPAESRVSAAERAERLAQKPATLWLTGLAGAGKLTLAAALERRLFDLGASALALDERRYGAERSAAAAFAAAEETARVRRMAEAARLLNEAGLIVICACLSPLTEHRRAAAEIVGPDRFVEIYVAAPPAWCEAHDRSNLYTRARRGELNNVPGIDAPYEKPAAPRLVLSPAELSVTEAVSALVQLLRETGIFPLRGTALT